MSEQPSQVPPPLPALIRAARNVYGAVIHEALASADCDDMPRNGIYLIGGIARFGIPLSRLIKELGVSKQAAGQLVDTLVIRGYLDRAVDPEDRRRLTITLTERGMAAAAASRAAIDELDAELQACVGATHIAHTRATLAALVGLRRKDDTPDDKSAED